MEITAKTPFKFHYYSFNYLSVLNDGRMVPSKPYILIAMAWMPPSNKIIFRFLKRNGRDKFYNKVCFQEKFTMTCGHFCLYFSFKFAIHLELNYLSLSNKKINERFIKKSTRQEFWRRKCCPFIYAKKQLCKS